MKDKGVGELYSGIASRLAKRDARPKDRRPADRRPRPPKAESAPAKKPDLRVVPGGLDLPKPEPKRAKRISLDVLARAMRKPAKERINPFVLANHPKNVFPTKGRSTGMAQDEAINASLAFAAQGILTGVWEAGLSFMGYPYLSELAQRAEYRVIVETLATDSTRKWIKLQASTEDGEDRTEKIKQLEDELDRLKLRDVIRKTSAHDGFFGRGHIYLDTGDTDEPDELLTPLGNGRNRISQAKVNGKKRKLERLQNVEPIWCYPSQYNATNPLKPDWYKPSHWFAMGNEIHRSRLLTFVAREVPDLLKPAYSFGGLAMTQMAKPTVDNWLRTRQSVSDITHAYSVMVLETDMSETLSESGDALFTRLDLFNAFRDNRGIMAINNQGQEKLTNVAAPLGSLDLLQAQAQEHMASISRTPIVKLLGIQPAGLNASSEGEINTWDDWVAAYQEMFYREPITRIMGFAMLNLWGKVDENITFVFEPLRQMTEKERAELQKSEADADGVFIDKGVLAPEEVRARLAAAEGSPYASIDVEDVPEPPDQGEGGDGPDGGGGKPPGGETPEAEVGKDAVIPFPVARDAWSEAEHPRGQPGNAGQFGSGGGGSSKTKQKLTAPQFGMPHGHFTAGGQSPGFPAPKKGNVGEPIDVSTMKKVGKQMGSNPGGVYEDGEGGKFYVKKGQTKDHVTNEMTAAALYGLAGSPTLRYRPVEGGTHVATEMSKLDKDNAAKLSPEERHEAQREFAVHAWLGNYDAVGLGGDNLGTVKGVPTALDLGGALEYRAQGKPKGSMFGDQVGEIDSLRDPKINKDAAGMFGDMTPAQLRESARYVTSLKDSAIKDTVLKAGGSQALADKLVARKRDLAVRARTFGAEGDPKKPTSTMVVPIGAPMPVDELNGVKFEEWKAPEDWAKVEGQADIEEPEFVPTKGKKPSTGVIITEKDGRVWIVQPRGGYGDYEGTFPKGGLEEGLSPQANAIKEAWEESGLKVRIVRHAGDVDGDMTTTRYYHAVREGGDPSKHEDETDGVVLVPKAKAGGFLNRTRDHKVLGLDALFENPDLDTQYWIDQTSRRPDVNVSITVVEQQRQNGRLPIIRLEEEEPDDGEPAEDEANFEESKHPRDKGGKFAETAGGGAEEHPETEEESEPEQEEGETYPGLPGEVYPKAAATAAPQFKSKKEHAAHLLTKGTTTKEMLEALKWPSISMPAMAKTLGMKLEKTKGPGGASIYKGVPMTPEEKKLATFQANVEAEQKKKAATPASAAPAPVITPAPPKQNFPAPTQAELDKAKKNVALQMQYVPGGNELQFTPTKAQAQKMLDSFNEKYANKTLTDPKALAEKVNDFKTLAASISTIKATEAAHASVLQQQEAAAQAKAKAAQAEKNKAAAEAAAKQQAAEKNKLKEQHAEVTKELGITDPDELEAFDAFVDHFGGTAKALQSFKSWQTQAQSIAKNHPGHGFEKLSGFEMGCIKAYTGPQSGWINTAIRDDIMTPAQFMFEKVLNKALGKLPTQKKPTKRGLTLDGATQAKLVPGKIWTHRNFASSSSSGWGGNTKLHIEGKTGRYVDPISSHKGEDETLFPSNLKLLVDKVEKKDGVMHVHCREV